MRFTNELIVALGCAAWIAIPAAAQEMDWARPCNEDMGLLLSPMLLGNPSVQKELGFDPRQVEEGREMARRDFAKVRENNQKGKGIDEEERERRARIYGTWLRDAQPTIVALLKPDQLKRLEQIEFQRRGMSVLLHPVIQRELKLTEEQKGKLQRLWDGLLGSIRTIAEENRGKPEEFKRRFLEASEENRGKPEESKRRFLEATAETKKQMLEALTAEQRARWDEWTGKPFKLGPFRTEDLTTPARTPEPKSSGEHDC
jgi:hypothetical protein